MDDIYKFTLTSLQGHQNYWISSAAVVKKTVVQESVLAENMICLALLCAEYAVVHAVPTRRNQISLMNSMNLTWLLSRTMLHLGNIDEL